ncbi:MAG: hypothetical protein OET79_03575, partial [Nitrospirota bacterium]|nr:hypothetical protein [Nitrospirota bacterium]
NALVRLRSVAAGRVVPLAWPRLVSRIGLAARSTTGSAAGAVALDAVTTFVRGRRTVLARVVPAAVVLFAWVRGVLVITGSPSLAGDQRRSRCQILGCHLGDRMASAFKRCQCVAHHLPRQLTELLAFMGIRLQDRLGVFHLHLDRALGRSTLGQPLGGGEVFLHPALAKGQHFSIDRLQAAHPGLARPDHGFEIATHQSRRVGATLPHLVLDVMNRGATIRHVVYLALPWAGDPARRFHRSAINRRFVALQHKH